MSSKEALKRARRGAKLLDKKLGRGWRRKIRRRNLDMSRGSYEIGECGCVLAQLYGSYDEGLEALDISWGEDERLGFDRDDEVGYDDLDEAWLQTLREGVPS